MITVNPDVTGGGQAAMLIKLILTARSLNLMRAFQRHFDGVEGVEFEDKDIVSIPDLDAVVSPANAYGWMDGGVDQVYVYTFGQQIEDRVQETIRAKYSGRLPVGAAFVIPTHHTRIPYLVVAPTMKFPGPIRGTKNPYLALKAALHAVIQFNRESSSPIKRLGCPGLGTGTGGLPADEAALQMKQAFTEFHLAEA